MPVGYQFPGQRGPAVVIAEGSGRPQPGAVIEVNNLDGSLATLYADRLRGAPAANPVTADGDGKFFYYAEPAQYDEIVTIGAVVNAPQRVSVRPDPAEQDADLVALQNELDAHETGGSGAHAASGVSVVPTGSIAATNVQAALAELDAELDAEAATRASADALLIPLTQKGAADGVATLGPDGKLPSAQVPALAIGETSAATSQAAMLALTAQRGDVAVRTDLDPDGVFILIADDPTVLANWVQITTPGTVTSVNGQPGPAVVLPSDGATDTASLRTLGTGAAQALPGDYPVVTRNTLVVNVRNYGAVGDGVADDTVAVQAALAALPNNKGILYFPPGTYGIGSAIQTTTPGITVRGAGLFATRIVALAGFVGNLLTIGGQFSTVEDITLDGAGLATDILKITNNRVLCRHLYITGATGSGLILEGTVTVPAHGNHFTDVLVLGCTAYGVNIKGSFVYDQQFEQLWVGTSGVGVRVEGSNSFFSNLHVWGCGSVGVEIRALSCRFANVHIETNTGSGVTVFNAARTVIHGGHIWKNGSVGINITGSADRCQFVGLNVRENGGSGIAAANANHLQVVGCIFHDDQATKTQSRPVTTTGTSDFAAIVGCSIRAADHLTGGVSLVGTNNALAGNTTGDSHVLGNIEIEGALDHDGTTAGFYGVAPVARPGAYTQTYATADRTLAAYTSDPESTAYSTPAALLIEAARLADLNQLRAAYETLRVFTEDAVQMLNSVVDDLQANGLLQ
jgi:hypothetical protein